jgi:cytochrome c7-like protein/class III cytochrome C family protein
MAQIFHPSFNTISKLSIFGLVFFVAGAIYLGAVWIRSPYYTQVSVHRDQPIPFSHKHHVFEVGIDCRYCHHTVEETGFAGIPSTETCMTCHSQIWLDSPMLEPVRASYRTNKPIEWVRVHDLPDFVYFDHSIHVAKGVGCASCHGRVDLMPLTWREHSLHMDWCLECHRAPEKFVRPREEVFAMAWEPSASTPSPQQLLAEYHVEPPTNCSVCHR